MTPDPVRAIADAVLYEGYILWPYRRSALKNQRRFTFGGVYPPAHAEAHPDDRCLAQTEVLAQGDVATRVEVAARFLHIVHRTPARRCGSTFEPVDELTIGGERYVSWEEAVEREIRTPPIEFGPHARAWEAPIDIAAGRERELLGETGAVIRTWAALRGTLRVESAPVAPATWRVSAAIENRTAFDAGAGREAALVHAFCSTHILLHAAGGAFVSLTDPPRELAAPAAACRNVGTWPVLVGEPGDRDTMLASPIILEDHPRVAPESPGDLFDGGEIDQLLILNILALTDEEQAEMAASDPRAREILERTKALTPEQLMALHATVREVGLTRP